MKLFRRLIILFISGWLISACFNPPEYPVKPEISFVAVYFIDVKDPPNGAIAADSLILQIKFRDGDGDLGISSGETTPPFNDRWYLLNEPVSDLPGNNDCHDYGNKCWELRDKEISKYISYKQKRAGGPIGDTLRAFVKPYNCTNWDVVRDNTGKVIDTLYFHLNPHYNNITVEIQTKNSDGTFSIFNWNDFLTYPGCEIQGFNGRFPILNESQGQPTPLEGIIKYSMPSPFFKIIFSIKTLRLKVSIEDRSLNRSNEIITPEFTLQ